MKAIKELKPGDVFIDTLGSKLKVEKIQELSNFQVPHVRVYLVTEAGNRMYQRFRSDREVQVVSA